MSEKNKILLLLKLDSMRLLGRVRDRAPEYMQIFSSRRTRDHFGEIFKTKYSEITMGDLKHCGEEVLLSLDQFYGRVDDLRWYLGCTQEMPATVEEHLMQRVGDIEKSCQSLQLHIDADME